MSDYKGIVCRGSLALGKAHTSPITPEQARKALDNFNKGEWSGSDLWTITKALEHFAGER